MFGNRGGFGSNKQDNDQLFDVYVARIPQSVDEGKLMDIFSTIGKVKSVSIKKGKDNYQSNYAFIKYTNEDDAICAAKYMNNTPVDNSNLLVTYRKKDGQGSGSDSGSSGSSGFQRQTSNERSATRGGFTANRGRGGFGSGKVGSTSSSGFSQNNQGFQKDNNMTNGFNKSDDLWDEESSNQPTDNVTTPPKEKTIQKESVLVMNVDHPVKLWGQAVVQEVANAIVTISEDLQTQCPSLPHLTDYLPYGKMFACKFTVDDLWYRCKVEKQHGQKLKVRYIDYGNCEDVDLTSLVTLPPSLAQPAPCAKEYTLDVKPVSLDEESDKFKQATEFLRNMVLDQVVRFETNKDDGQTVVAYLDKTNKDIAKEVVAAGHATVIEKPKPTEERPSFTKQQTNAQAIRPPRGVNSFQVSRENQELKNKIEAMEAQLDKFKQEKNQLESSLKESKALKNSSVMSTKLNSLIGEVAALKKLRDEMHLEESLTSQLKSAVDLLENKDISINLSTMTVYQQLLRAEEELNRTQEDVKNCSDKETLGDFVTKRDESRKNLLEKMQSFLQYSCNLSFDTRQKELEAVLSDIRNKYVLPATLTDTSTVAEAVQAYEDWRFKKIDTVRELQSVANKCSLHLNNYFDNLRQKVDLNYQQMLIAIDIDINGETSTDNIDKLIEDYSKSINQEISQIKESNINTEAKQMVMNLVVALVSAVNAELSDIRKLRDELLQTYETKKDDITQWIHKVPDVSKLKRTRNTLKNLKSKFRHKQADRRDFEEDPDEKEQLAQTEKELGFIRNELHAIFVEEHKLLGELSNIAATHFPELPLQHSDLGIGLFLETNGLVRVRELEHYDHHALPLLSSATKQPVIFKTIFNQQPCIIKEYSLNDGCSKDKLKSAMINYSKCKHENLISLDGLFFDKGGRKAYLQTKLFSESNLLQLIKTKPDSTELYKLLHGVLKGLACLHKNNLVHGSISPKSIFINKDDGGVTALLEEPNFAKDEAARFKDLASFSLTISYPSISAESELPSPLFDVYCFGLLMLWAYFPDASFSGDIRSILSDVVKDNPVGDLLECLLSKVPSLRMTAEDALMHAFFETAEERSQTPSEELLSTMKDLNDSFVNIESSVPVNIEVKQAPTDSAVLEQGLAGTIKPNLDETTKIDDNDTVDKCNLEVIKPEVSESEQTEQKPEETDKENPIENENEGPETFSEEWKN